MVNHIGTDKIALSTLNTILNMQTPTAKEVTAQLTHKMFSPLRPQVLDVLGAIQNLDIYSAIMSVMMDKKEDYVDDLERYFQTLAVAAQPNRGIVQGRRKEIPFGRRF